MDDIEKLKTKLEMLEARCVYMGVVCSAMLHALPDKVVFLEQLTVERLTNDANSLYSTSLSDRQRQTIQDALDALDSALRTTPH